MPSVEISEWIAYLTVEPHGTQAFDLFFGQLYQLFIGANSKEGAPDLKECMPIYNYQRRLTRSSSATDYDRARAVMGGAIHHA